MADETPALPWASAAAITETIEPDLPSTLQQPLSRIEVKWEIEDTDGEGNTVGTSLKWWGARVDGKAEGRRDGEGRQCYVLRYDAHEGFDEEVRHVTFINEHTLYDLADDDELLWRREGEEWDAAAAEDEEEGEGAEVQVMQLGEVVAAIQQAERRRGRTVEQDCLELVSGLPPEQQRMVASGFSSYAETLASGIRELCEARGPGYVVTEADIRTVTAAAMQKLREGGALMPPTGCR